MPKAEITTELSETLKTLRIQNKIQGKDLANFIHKSPAYISKLENGGIKNIDLDQLYDIFYYISKGEDIEDILEQIYQSLKIKYSKEEIERQLWFQNFDTVKCILPLSKELILDINSLINEANISRDYLLQRINANESIEDSDMLSSMDDNVWYQKKETDAFVFSIKIHMTQSLLNDILDNKLSGAPYIFVFCIVFYSMKICNFHETIKITELEYAALYAEAEHFLDNHQFFTFSRKQALICESENKEQIDKILNSFDKDNRNIINDILTGFHFFSEKNIQIANEQLKQFNQNMHWDLGFTLKIVSLNFNSLKNLNFTNKKALISEIEHLIEKYANINVDDNRLEEY